MAILLILIFGVLRFWVVMDAYQSGSNGRLALLFTAMILLSVLLLRGTNRREAGFVRPRSFWWLLAALADGAILALLIGWLGNALYGNEISNWYVYVRKAYPFPAESGGPGLLTLFWIAAGTSMVFSPLGEEFFYRGLIHHALRSRFSSALSTVADAMAFAFTHLCHFGLVFHLGRWEFLPVPAAIWVSLMLASALLFTLYKRLSGSIWGAVLAHAGFNLGMTYFVFFQL